MTLLGLLLLHGAHFAQPVIDLGSLPPPDCALQRFWVAFQQAPSLPSGASQTWDITGNPYGPGNCEFAAPNGFSGGIDTQDATVMLAHPFQMTYYRSDQDGYAVISTYHTAGDAPNYYTDPIDLLIYPCTYGTAWSDTYVLVDEGGALVETGGPVAYTADGYGTLITDLGTFTDVLKVRSTHSTNWINGNGEAILNELIIDRFWRQGTPWWVAMITESRTYVNGVLDQNIANGEILNAVFTGGEEFAGSLESPLAYPNPAHDRLTMNLPADGRSQVTVHDGAGRVVLATAASGGQRTLELGGLAPGTYVLHVVNEHGTERRSTVVVQ